MRRRRSFAAAILLVCASVSVSCGDDATSGADGGEFMADAGAWASATVELTSGLLVHVQGPVMELEAIATMPSAAELCDRFELSVTLLFDPTTGALARYSAAAHPLSAPHVCDASPDPLCEPYAHIRRFLVDLLTEWNLPDSPQNSGYFNHPLGISFMRLDSLEGDSPWYTTVYDSRSLAPVAGLVHNDDGSEFTYFPTAWSAGDAAERYTGPPLWARIVEQPFDACVDPDNLMVSAMELFFIGDLADCGIVFGLPFPVADPTTPFEQFSWCPSAMEHFGLVLSARPEHPLFSTECPRPASAPVEYQCYSP